MKKVIVIICLFVLNVLFSQNKLEEINSEYERVYVEVGLVKPIGNLSNKFELSPSYGFWFRSRIKNDDYIDIGLNVMIPQKVSNINFTHNDSVFSLGSKRLGINLGFRFAKVFPFSNVSPRNNVEWNTGFGVSTLFYDANHKRHEDIMIGEYKNDNNKTYDYGLTSLFLSQGIKLNFRNVGLQFNYQFTPYGLFEKRIEPNFGSQSLLFGIYYRQ
ncbi:MAG: hypothetical protein V4666_10480 [Bacteroidota bacterium]